tara:strand:- start:873 stop:1370 length:498 start_codon:yes stop_codon:yes gene_type:complete
MERNLIVLDNFLDDPDKIRHCALSLDFDRVQKDVPGVRSCRIAGDIQTEVESKLKSALGCKEIDWIWNQDTFCFQSCVEGTKTWVHVDPISEWAAVLYLTPNAPLDSGTAIYQTPDDDMNIGVGNIYNRMVAYRGKVLYHRSILPGFGYDLETSRLTMTLFFDIK